MRALTVFVRRHPVLAYAVLTFGISWGGVLLAIGGSLASATSATADPRFAVAVVAMLAGPPVSALLLTALLDGPAGLAALWRRVVTWRVPARWYAVALLAAPVVWATTQLWLALASPHYRPGLVTSSDRGALIRLGLMVGVSAGVFEELGWTGFAVPHLRRRHGTFTAGVLLGGLWGAWHLLTNVLWASGVTAGDMPRPAFLWLSGLLAIGGYLTAFRVVMVWVHDRTNSVLVAMLMHACLTATVLTADPEALTGLTLLAYSAAIAATAWVAAVVVGAVAGSPKLEATPPFLAADGTVLPDSIAEAGYVRLGGVDQWVLIRGARRTNPALVVLHGGPGFSETHFFRRFNAPLETSFTVVYWDQRGAGKSFDPGIPKASMTVERFLADLDELIDHVRGRLDQPTVALFGHSWGSALGALYAARFPRKVSAYIGCEQVGDSVAAERASYAFALGEATRRHDEKALAALRAIGTPPYSASSLMTERTWVQRLEGQMSVRTLWTLLRGFLACPEYSLRDLPALVRGFRFSLDAMYAEVSRLNLMTLVPALRVPTVFLLARRDRWIPPETSVAYIDALQAPSKQLVWFEASGHEPFVDEPARFNATMRDLVRPLIDARAVA
jgi:pimeloyl-ACP methyl ester carboxylesterase/membrane protease YdiL (CAAX protease family)